ncbi:hypothetical protein GCM10010358_81930 [Streptomyces minutiscleroticus]|uniref:Uncharacterized protein n=1 Tax=Streptomyces minutiscleroticus TaxID=68238 RepID=A0A918UAT7_9ACTN|nr:hypothetical protein [Streptomyces minutiscleroticus]GGY18296.1 hypothetical protein GCM10010358_81930 [Streptomyces minutiscleroticus]
MELTFDDDWRATVTDDPLPVTPRFAGSSVAVAPYGDVEKRERFLAATFGSQEWLWDTPDVLRFDRESRRLAGAEFRMPYTTADHESVARIPAMPATRPGGLRADEVRDFRLETCTVLCRAPEDGVLVCLRALDVLDEPLEACVGIAPDLALLVQHATVVGWRLTDPVRYLTTAFTDPDPAPPAGTTRRLFTECLDLVTVPVADDVADGEPAALARLRAADQALRAQREDRYRAGALLELIATMVEDYGDR